MAAPAPRLRPLALLGALALACGPTSGTSEGESEGTTTGTDTTTEGGSASASSTGADLPTPHGWQVSAHLDTDIGSIFSIWGDGPETIMAVGGQPTVGVILEYVDGAWVPDPGIPPSTPRLNWIHGIGEDRVAVGYYGAVIHRVGGVWEPRESNAGAPLWGVWGASADDLWAVGGAGMELPPVMIHFDGEAWTPVDVSAVSGESHALYKIWGRAADDIYAIGSLGLILHYDGNTWSSEETPTTSTLIGIHGDDDEVIVAGGRASGVVLRRQEGVWNALAFPDDQGFDGAWIDPAGYATVVGRRGFIALFAPESSAWVREESGVEEELHSVFGIPGGPVFAVGGFFDKAPYTGVILERLP
ncbi:MAG: hypothetical protein H6710_13965 [Myxococcales bacterium]|nr:hypothetical protein [Myxococcales bacterium]